MIFVTVGTTHFDSLIRAVDVLNLPDRQQQEVIFQIGSGEYIPQTGKWFRFKPSIDDELENANLVVTHGGMTVLSLLTKERRFVSIANTALADNHQVKMLRMIAGHSAIIWSDRASDVQACIDRALQQPPVKWTAPSLVPHLLSTLGVGQESAHRRPTTSHGDAG